MQNEYYKSPQIAKSIVRYLMSQGLILGLWFIVEYIVVIKTTQNIMLSMVHTLMMIGTVILLYRTIYKLREHLRPLGVSYAQAWIYGVELMFFAGLLEAMFIVIYNQWIHPTNLVEMHNALIAQYGDVMKMFESLNSAGLESMKITMQQQLEMLQKTEVETPINAAMNSLSSNINYGMLWMVLFAFFLKRAPQSETTTNQ